MTEHEIDALLRYLKLLADETRLRMIGLLSTDEYRTSDLAEHLGLTEPTVSHHIARLREVGLLNLRTEGTNRYYRLNDEMLTRLKALIDEVERLGHESAAQAEDDNAWIDALGLEAWEAKVLRDYTFNRRLKQLPRQQKKLHVILRWLVTLFEPGRHYSEREVSELLAAYNEDYAGLRRDLVDFGYLQREGGGKSYWRA